MRPRVLFLRGPRGVATIEDYSNTEVIYHVARFWMTSSDRRGPADASDGRSELNASVNWALHQVGIGHVWVEHSTYDWTPKPAHMADECNVAALRGALSSEDGRA